MKKAVIWDLDGTLFDSYDVIVDSIRLALGENGVSMPAEEIHRHAIEFSIKSLFAKVSAHTSIPVETMQVAYSRISTGKCLQIRQMPNAIACLKALEQAGIENYVFTHRGRTTMPVLENLQMTGYFKDVVTSTYGFARKPDPEGIHYLMKRYQLDRNGTYYVGDRSLDMACAANAGIPGILFLPTGGIDVSGGSESFIVKDLMQIPNIILTSPGSLGDVLKGESNRISGRSL